jgi:hypothetical protein
MITKDSSAFPVDDVGLQNAVKQQLGLSKNQRLTISADFPINVTTGGHMPPFIYELL